MSGEHEHPDLAAQIEVLNNDVASLSLSINPEQIAGLITDLEQQTLAIDMINDRVNNLIDRVAVLEFGAGSGSGEWTAWYVVERIDAGGPGSAPDRGGWKADLGGQVVDKRNTNWDFSLLDSPELLDSDQIPRFLWDYERYGTLVRQWVVPDGVGYYLRVMTGEGWPGNFKTGGRIVQLSLNGIPVVENLDMFSSYGREKAIILEGEATPVDGKIVLELKATSTSVDPMACWNGIELLASSDVGTVTGTIGTR